MKDKYYDRFISYDVIEHGSEFEPSTNFGLVCPECCSTSINIENDDGTASDVICWNIYVCKDCGCKFTAKNNIKLNEKGLKMLHIFNFLFTIFGILSGISLVLTIIFVFMDMDKANIVAPFLIICISCLLLSVVFGNISEDM